MIKIVNKKECCGCYACYNICPNKAITMVEDEKGFFYPKVDENKCTKCGLCEKVCPIRYDENNENEPQAYACINRNEHVRSESSSGGIFSLIAEHILDKKGVVYGAAFDESFHVNHICIESKEELYQLQGSKYVQSQIKETYKKAKEFLESDRYVLFTGTPCQIEGLKRYLMKDYEKLYTQDIICHGVPSPKVWEKYLEFRKSEDAQLPQTISFRNKDKGWHVFSLKFQYANGVYKKSLNEDSFLKLFLTNAILRDSCYECHFKKKQRISDITLADFWGIENVLPKLDDDKGISLVILNSDKGKQLFEKISQNIISEKVELEDAIKYNTSMVQSANLPKNNADFWKEFLKGKSIDMLDKKYAVYEKTNILKRMIGKIKRILIDI